MGQKTGKQMNYYHVDVFSSEPMSGNGLTVVFPDKNLEYETLLMITREFRQFETIFIYPVNNDGCFPARIFTADEELDFAGHPVLGGGAVLHYIDSKKTGKAGYCFNLPGEKIKISSEVINDHYLVTMNQGKAEFIGEADLSRYDEISKSLNLSINKLDRNFPVETVSTGLPYLIVPVSSGIEKVKISNSKFEDFLASFGAKFVYVFDTATMECRTWDNSGLYEDVATGSAAGPLCSYLVKHGVNKPDEVINIHQGSFLNRPSIINGWVEKESRQVYIRGKVSFFGKGEIFI